MNFRNFATSVFGTKLWLALGRWLPPRAGYAVARGLSGTLARRRHADLYCAIRANQAIVRRGAASGAELDRAVAAVLHHGGRTAYDVVRLVAAGEEALRNAMAFPAAAWADLAAARAGGRGVMVCGPHLSNFNLAFLAFALREMPLQILLTAAPGGYQLVEALLNRHAVHATQIDLSALREAVGRLRSGGMVLTGVDWPQAPGETEELPFFGRPARLPVGHVRLALSTGAAILPVAVRWDPGTGYRLATAAPIVPNPGGIRGQTVRDIAVRVLAVLERWIAERPEQWLMYYPVWPSAVRLP